MLAFLYVTIEKSSKKMKCVWQIVVAAVLIILCIYLTFLLLDIQM